ncbi:MAG: dTDP-4-dehydrorhamnose reductase [Saprospiraceae bacterium]|jgi:dTDP-4-dehydrorhamnose reductase
MLKLLITGSNGQLGQSFQQEITNFPICSAVFFDKAMLDICKPMQIRKVVSEVKPDFIINCAAYTAVDEAENNIFLAQKINEEGPAHLGKIAADLNIPVIHFSSDYVYHNHSNKPLKEGDPTNPVGIYAQTKLAGEKQLLHHQPHSYILRTSWVFSPFGKNFLKSMHRLASQKKVIRVVSDQIGAPTYAPFMAKDVLQMAQQIYANPNKFKSLAGIYNYCPEGVCSWYDFAYFIFKYLKVSTELIAIPSEAYPTPVSRPPFSVMNTQKIKSAFGLKLKHWDEGLLHCLKAMN